MILKIKAQKWIPRILVTTFLFSGALASKGQSFDVTEEYRNEAVNPNGTWSYGALTVDFATFSLFTTEEFYRSPGGSPGWSKSNSANIWKNLEAPQFGVPTGAVSLHPGSGQQPAVVRWTAPSSGSAHVYGRFLPGDSGAMHVAVHIDGTNVWDAIDSGAFDLRPTVAEGSHVDFLVYGGYAFGNTPLEVKIDLLSSLSLQIELRKPNAIVTVSSVGVEKFVVQFTPSLAMPIVWTDLATNLNTSEATFSVTNNASNGSGFYRARALQP